MITLYQLFITIGIMVSYIVDLASAPHWRVMFGLGAVPGVVLAVGMSFMPSSPRWLASRGRMAEAKKFLIAHSNLRWPRLPCAKFKPISILKKSIALVACISITRRATSLGHHHNFGGLPATHRNQRNHLLCPAYFSKSWICR